MFCVFFAHIESGSFGKIEMEALFFTSHEKSFVQTMMKKTTGSSREDDGVTCFFNDLSKMQTNFKSVSYLIAKLCSFDISGILIRF